jgi:hypothetical protein
LAGDAHRDVFALDLLVLEDPLEVLDHRAAVHYVAVDDRLGRQLGEAEPYELEPLSAVFELADFDRARADVDPDEVVSFRHLEWKCGTPSKTESKNRCI